MKFRANSYKIGLIVLKKKKIRGRQYIRPLLDSHKPMSATSVVDHDFYPDIVRIVKPFTVANTEAKLWFVAYPALLMWGWRS